MTYLLGLDEAGYGPNLGPLVIGASLWRTPQKQAGSELPDLYELLKPAIAGAAVAVDDTTCLALADSKALYSPGSGWASLERGVHAALQLTGSPAATFRETFSALGAVELAELDQTPWYAGYDCPLPRDADAAIVQQLAANLHSALQTQQCQLLAVRGTAVLPAQFNAGIDRTSNKAVVLSQTTIQLAADMIAEIEEGPICINFDKHGGRNRYAPLLQQFFPEYLVETRHEGAASSVYQWGPPQRRVEARFVAKGESFAPSALASMIAKYLREIAMQAFNQFWAARVPALKPTAGYPVDAKRFKSEIATAQKEAGITDQQLWRKK